jgi:membrane protein
LAEAAADRLSAVGWTSIFAGSRPIDVRNVPVPTDLDFLQPAALKVCRVRDGKLGMKVKEESLLGALALLGIAAALAYLGPEHDHPYRPAEVRSDESAPLLDASSSGRGRHARSPTGIPAKGWKDIVWRTYEQINEDRLLAVAAGAVFYGLLALFPAITALVSSYALLADAKTVNDHIAFLSEFLPQGTFSIIQDQVGRVLSKGDMKLGGTFLASLMLAIWSANGGVKAIIDALNVVYDEKEKRGFFKLNAVSLAFTVAGVAGILTAIGLVIAAPVILSMIGLQSSTDLLVRYGRWPLLAILLLMGLAVLYRYAPSRTSPKWRWISVGSVVATFTWMIGSGLLSYYLANFGHYDATYGSLGAAIALMIWMWMSTIVVLFGAELNSEIEHQTAADSTTGVEKPLGSRGAKMADTLGASL